MTCYSLMLNAQVILLCHSQMTSSYFLRLIDRTLSVRPISQFTL
ncbi:hypothetical protein [uncultured Haemophilus sp.]|nr:hypothetical protein [uncultured Haemophilus sp.]